MTGQALTRAGPYLSLTVPGMLEGRPSLRKVLLSSLPVTSVDITSPVWSVPSIEKLSPPSPSSKLLSVLPHSFLPPPSPSPPPYYPLPPPTTPLTWLNTTLNPEQCRAVTNILSAVCRPIPYILYGPPGTGKTVTLVIGRGGLISAKGPCHLQFHLPYLTRGL